METGEHLQTVSRDSTPFSRVHLDSSGRFLFAESFNLRCCFSLQPIASNKSGGPFDVQRIWTAQGGMTWQAFDVRRARMVVFDRLGGLFEWRASDAAQLQHAQQQQEQQQQQRGDQKHAYLQPLLLQEQGQQSRKLLSVEHLPSHVSEPTTAFRCGRQLMLHIQVDSRCAAVAPTPGILAGERTRAILCC